MNRGNRHRLNYHARRIVRGLADGTITLTGVMAKYHVGHPAARAFVAEHFTDDEWTEIRHRNHARGGIKGRFKKGHVPWTAGRKGIRLSPATEFKPGCMRGQAARNWRPLETITVRNDHLPKRRRRRKRKGGRPWPRQQRRFIKVRDFGSTQDRWVPVARYFWELAYGPIPPGMSVVYADGNSLNDSLANYRLVTRAERLALQRKNNPKMLALCRRAAGRAAKKRYAAARHMRQAARTAAPASIRWECHACGYDVGGAAPPDRCPKCGGGAFERVMLRRAV